MPTFQRHAMCAVLVGLLGAGGVARAGEDAAAREAADANTEPPKAHSQLIPTFAFGGGFTLGFGVKNAAGTGGGFVLRLAHVASRKAMVAIELLGAAQFARVEDNTTAMTILKTYRTDTTAILASGQYYARPGFWLRVAAGFGSYHNQALAAASGGPVPLRYANRDNGIAGSVGAGVDLLSLSHLHLGVELMSTNLITRDGMINATALLVGLSIQ